MARFKPSGPFVVPMMLLVPTYTTAKGAKVKTYPAVADGIPINGSFKTYGGTETEIDGVYSIEDTAQIETWYRPEIKSDCRIALREVPQAIYDILGEPEDIELRHQFMRFKVRRAKGGA